MQVTSADKFMIITFTIIVVIKLRQNFPIPPQHVTLSPRLLAHTLYIVHRSYAFVRVWTCKRWLQHCWFVFKAFTCLECLILLSLFLHTYMYTVDVGRLNYVSRNVVTTKLDNWWLVRRSQQAQLSRITLSTVMNYISSMTLSRRSGAVSTQTTVACSTQSDRWTTAKHTQTRYLVSHHCGKWTPIVSVCLHPCLS